MKTYKEDNQNLLFKSIKTAYCNQRVASEIELALCVGDALPPPQKTADFRVTALTPPLPLTHHRSMYTMKGQRCVLSRVGLRADIINTSAPRGYVLRSRPFSRPAWCLQSVRAANFGVCVLLYSARDLPATGGT